MVLGAQWVHGLCPHSSAVEGLRRLCLHMLGGDRDLPCVPANLPLGQASLVCPVGGRNHPLLSPWSGQDCPRHSAQSGSLACYATKLAKFSILPQNVTDPFANLGQK